MANKLLGIFLYLALSACSTPSHAPTVDEGALRQGGGEVEKPTSGTTEGQAAAIPPDPKCMTQLKQGYALRERIDNEYWQSRRAGTFQDQREEFTARCDKEAVAWAAETRVVLLQMGGPSAKARFQNAQTPIGTVNGDEKWNNTRNFLRTRLAALEGICKAP